MYSNNKIEGPRILHEPEKYKNSMEKLRHLDIDVILTGHGQPITSEANNKLETFLEEIWLKLNILKYKNQILATILGYSLKLLIR